MKLQPTFLHPHSNGSLYLLGFRFCPTVHNRIIGLPFDRQMRIGPLHPPVERLVQKQIGQQGTGDSALRRALPTLRHVAVLLLRWRF